MNEARFPYDYIPDSAKGRPLFNASLYYGVPDLDPEIPANQVSVSLRQEDGSIVSVSQPVNTGVGGVPMYNGSPVTILIDEDIFSFKALDKNGSQIYYEARAESALGSGSTVGNKDTYADVRAITDTGFDYIIVGGANTLGDGGGGVFVKIASGADDGGIILATSGGDVFARQYSGQIMVQWYEQGNLEAWQAAAAAGKSICGESGASYSIAGTINLQSDTIVDLNGCSITQTASQTPIFDITSKTGVTIKNGTLNGLGADYVDSSLSLARGITGFNSVNTSISGVKFNNFAYSSFYGEGVVAFSFTDNIVVGPGVSVLTPGVSRNNTGVTVGGDGIVITGNIISETGQGLIVAQGSSDIMVSGNVIFDIIVEHGMYFDTGLINLAVTSNSIRDTYQNGIKVQWYDSFGITPECITVSDNVISGTTTGDGIIFINSTPTGSPLLAQSVEISNNVIRNAGQDGLACRYIENSIVSDNSITISGRSGINVVECNAVVFSGNTSTASQYNGISDDGSSADIEYKDNTIRSAGLAGVDANGGSSGIFINAGIGRAIIGNTVYGDNTKTQYCLFIAGGDQATMIVKDNIFIDAEQYGARFKSPVEPLMLYSGNLLAGALGESVAEPATDQLGIPANRVRFSYSVPVSGAHKQGDIVFNLSPVASGTIGWVCVTDGTPGTFKTFGPIAA